MCAQYPLFLLKAPVPMSSMEAHAMISFRLIRLVSWAGRKNIDLKLLSSVFEHLGKQCSYMLPKHSPFFQEYHYRRVLPVTPTSKTVLQNSILDFLSNDIQYDQLLSRASYTGLSLF